MSNWLPANIPANKRYKLGDLIWFNAGPWSINRNLNVAIYGCGIVDAFLDGAPYEIRVMFSDKNGEATFIWFSSKFTWVSVQELWEQDASMQHQAFMLHGEQIKDLL